MPATTTVAGPRPQRTGAPVSSASAPGGRGRARRPNRWTRSWHRRRSTALGPVRDPDRYRRRMPELIAPTTRLHTAWLQARHEWGPGVHEDGFGLRPSDEVDAPSGSRPGSPGWLTSRIRRRRWSPAGCVARTDGSSKATECSAESHCGTSSTTSCCGSATSATASGRPRAGAGYLGARLGARRGADARPGPGADHLRGRQQAPLRCGIGGRV
jgi:hypothetical protein